LRTASPTRPDKRIKAGLEIVQKKIVEKLKLTYILWAVFVSISGFFLWSAFSGEYGLFKFIQLKKSLQQMEAENSQLREAIDSLSKEVYLLRRSPAHIEELAREEYGYIADGEKIFSLSEPESPSVAKTE